MPRNGGIRWLLYAALVAAYALHNDLWLWNDGSLVLGLPAGLTYHVAFCLAVAALMVLLVRFTDDGNGEPGPKR